MNNRIIFFNMRQTVLHISVKLIIIIFCLDYIRIRSRYHRQGHRLGTGGGTLPTGRAGSRGRAEREDLKGGGADDSTSVYSLGGEKDSGSASVFKEGKGGGIPRACSVQCYC